MITIIAIADITSVGVFRLKMAQKQLYSITAAQLVKNMDNGQFKVPAGHQSNALTKVLW